MAQGRTTVKFGRLPAVQPDLTSTLVAIAREMQNQEDQNIMDAWKNGGLFEGKPATDSRVLAYWKERESNLATSDPEYDATRDQIMQLQYGVAQSKADLAHAQGKLSDAAYAQFFIGWAKKVPRDSEFWRTLQKDAANLMNQSRGNSAAKAQKAKTDAFNSYADAQSKDLAVGNALTDAINQMAKDSGLSVTDNGDHLLQMVSDDYKNNPNKYRALKDAMAGAGVTFPGQFTSAFAANEIGKAETAYSNIATRAKSGGFASAYSSAVNGQTAMASWGTNLKAWPVAKTYDSAYQQMMKIVGDPSASAMAKSAAASTFSQVCKGLAATSGIDAATKDMLTNDAERASGGGDISTGPSFGEAMLGHNGATNNLVAVSQIVLDTQTKQQAMDANPGGYVYAPVDKNGNFDSTGQGAVGIVPHSQVPPDAVFIAEPGLDGKATMVAVQPRDILVKDPSNPSADPISIGKVITYSVGGQDVTQYQYADATGVQHWTQLSPIATNASTANDPKGDLVVTPALPDPTVLAAQLDAKYGTSISAAMKSGQLVAGQTFATGQETHDSGGHLTGDLKIAYDGNGGFKLTNSSYTYDAGGHQTVSGTSTTPFNVNDRASLASSAISPSVASQGDIPGYTWPTALGASMAAAGKTNSGTQFAALAQSPDFEHAVLQQAMQAYNTTNAVDPRVTAAWEAAKADATPATASWNTPGGVVVQNAQDKPGLTYPGQAPAPKAAPTPSITFMGAKLNLPTAPDLNQNAAMQPAGTAGTVKGFHGTVLQPGQQPGVPATVKPIAPVTTITPTVTNVGASSAAPIKPPTATTAPAASAAPSAAPVGASSAAPYVPPTGSGDRRA